LRHVLWQVYFLQAEDGIRDFHVTGVQTCALPISLAVNGDAYDRCMVKMGEMRESLKIIEQCLQHMPEGPYKADHPLTTPPPKERSEERRVGKECRRAWSDGNWDKEQQR